MSTFPYFNSKYLEIPNEARANLKEAHKTYYERIWSFMLTVYKRTHRVSRHIASVVHSNLVNYTGTSFTT